MPITLKFSRPTGSEVTKGPFSLIRAEGEVLRTTAGGPLIARHVDHHWEVDGQEYTRLDCDCGTRLMVHFERIDGTKSRNYGPMRTFSFVDGIAYMDREVFAFADRTIVDWYCHSDGVHWPLMIIQALE